MSKLIDRLKQLSEGAPQPLGFHTSASAASKPKIQLIAVLSHDSAPDASLKEADAAFLRVGPAEAKEAIKRLCDKSKVPCGVYAAEQVESKELQSAGADFVVFAPATAVASVSDTKLGKLIAIDSTLTDSLLRAVNALDVDAVFVSSTGDGALTWQNLMSIHRITAMIDKPVLLSVSWGITQSELKTLWEAGVDGVVLDLNASHSGDLSDLRKKIDALDRPTHKRRSRSTPGVPRFSLEPEQQEDEDGDEDDE